MHPLNSTLATCSTDDLSGALSSIPAGRERCKGMVCVAAWQQLHLALQFNTYPVDSIGAPPLLSRHTGGITHTRHELLCSLQPFHAEQAPPELPFLCVDRVRLPITAYNPLLRDAGDTKDLPTGRILHARILLMGFLPDRFLENLLIQMYGKCGSLDDAVAVFASMHVTNVFSWTLLMGALIQSGMLDSARNVFDSMPERDVTSWNSMIAAYSQNGRDTDALKLFELMQMEGCLPDNLTFVSILTACAHMRDIEICVEMHASILSWGLERNKDLINPLINMYNKCGSVEDTQSIFNKLEEHTTFAWNALLAVHVRNGHGIEAFRFYKQMPIYGVCPDDVTFITLLGSFDSQDDLTEGRQMHACIVEAALETDIMTANSLISMYGRCEAIDDAHRIFNRMVNHTVISWNALIAAYAQLGHSNDSLTIFSEMEARNIEPNKVTFVTILDVCATVAALADGKKVHAQLAGSAYLSDFVVMTALLNMYGKCGSLEDAQGIFDSMTERDIISWNALISAYVQNEVFGKACQLFQRMQEETMQPDEVTYANVLIAYANQFAFVDGEELHARIVGDGIKLDTLVGNSIINFYGKCGRVEDAWIMFNKLLKQDVVSWNAIITAFSQHGHSRKALSLLHEMQMLGNFPNEVTFLSVLTAFSHNGLVDEGCSCFRSIIQVYLSTPNAEHYNVMVDLFGRAGRLDDAEAIIEKMPMEPDTTTWMGFVAACRKQSNSARGIQRAAHIFDLNPDHNPIYVMLSNLSILDDA